MIYGSVCSGIEAATVAWDPLGFKAAWYSEIEKFPCAVLKHHYPNTPNLGDMTKFKEWPDSAIDILVGGTPCQSFSVAGLRKGLTDPRGNLMLTFGAIAGRYRPAWLVWENVPGVLSSNGGKDFGAFLGMLAELGYGFAYRVLDAQYFGVPQRRRRVFVVGHLGGWRRAAAVLFERHSLQGHTAPGRKAGERIAEGSLSRALSRVGGGDDPGANKGAPLVSFDMRGNGDGKTVNCITGDHANRPTDYTPVICMETGQASAGIGIGTTLNCNHEAPIVAHSLRGEGFDASEDGPGRGIPLVAPCLTQNYGKQPDNSDTNAGPMLVSVAFGWNKSSSQTLRVDNATDALQRSPTSNPAVAFQPRIARNGRGNMGDQINALQAQSGQSGKGDAAPCIATTSSVRRLTPRECERLQGFPDDYTRIPGRGSWRALDEIETPDELRAIGLEVKQNKKTGKWRVNDPDGPRYKALGNSMAVPVMRWIGERIAMVKKML